MKDFVWGVATAAAQIEGAFDEDGKGLNIWDVFSRIPGTIRNGDRPDVSCDSYHKWKEDVKLLKDLGVNGYRYSVSWSRILPEGKGQINQKGLDYYRRLTDALAEAGIAPNITLYHWDLPYELERLGGWLNRDVADWFADYADIVFRNIPNAQMFAKTLTELKAELAKCEIHAGVEGPNVLRMTISSANDHADLKKLLKMDGTDVVVLKKGLGLNKYQCVKEDLTVSGLNDVAAPAITVERPDKPVNEAQYEIKFSVADDSEYDVVVKLGDTVIEPIEGKYIVTLVNGVNNITVTAKDKSIFANSSTETFKVKYEAIPEISISGITDGTTVKTADQKMAVSVDIGEITSVKLGEKVLTAGANGKYALALAEGENTIVIEAKNGETTGTLSIKVTLDTTAPEIVLSAKEETVASAEYTFTVKAEDAETIVVKVNGEAVTAGDNGYTVTLEKGENKITVTATDAAGNISSESVTVTYTPAGGNTDNSNQSIGCGGNIATDSLIIAIGLIVCAAFVLRRKVR